jgi:YD repeat-containing protein
MNDTATICRYFTTYSGVQLPFKLVSELGEHEIRNRNTFFRGYFAADGVFLGFQKVVYGEIEIEHQYTYDASGKLTHAEITDADGEITELAF